MKRLLLAVLIAVTGAGIAFGATQALYRTPDDSSDDVEPQGLVDEFSDFSRPELSPSPSPTPEAEPVLRSSGGGSAPAATAEPEQDGPRTPRGAERVEETPFPLDQPGAGDVCGDMEDLDDRERCREDEKAAEEEQERKEDAAEEAADNNK